MKVGKRILINWEHSLREISYPINQPHSYHVVWRTKKETISIFSAVWKDAPLHICFFSHILLLFSSQGIFGSTKLNLDMLKDACTHIPPASQMEKKEVVFKHWWQYGSLSHPRYIQDNTFSLLDLISWFLA